MTYRVWHVDAGHTRNDASLGPGRTSAITVDLPVSRGLLAFVVCLTGAMVQGCAAPVPTTGPAAMVTDGTASACELGAWDVAALDNLQGMRATVMSGVLRYQFNDDNTIDITADKWHLAYKNVCCEYAMHPDLAPRGDLALEGSVHLGYEMSDSIASVRWLFGGIRSFRTEVPATPSGSSRPTPAWLLGVSSLWGPLLLDVGPESRRVTYSWWCKDDDLFIKVSAGDLEPVGMYRPARLRRVR